MSYSKLIKYYGGDILNAVGIEGKKNVLLISNGYTRTKKYFYCLSAGIPCVSCAWIDQCVKDVRMYINSTLHIACQVQRKVNQIPDYVTIVHFLQRKVVDWAPYVLPAGWSIERFNEVQPHQKKPLQGCKIYLLGKLFDRWKTTLIAGGAVIIEPPTNGMI